MLCDPGASELTAKLPFPVLSNVAEPRDSVPSTKLTVPLGIPRPPLAETVSANRTASPNELGLGELVSCVPLALLFTVSLMAAEVDDWKLLSPE